MARSPYRIIGRFQNPYDAWSLDSRPSVDDDELLLNVSAICLDSTSARQLLEAGRGSSLELMNRVREIVETRGKMHNPETQSGGVLLGTVSELGRDRAGEIALGTQVVTLVSNTLVPLKLEKVLDYDPRGHQVSVVGTAVLPRFARYAAVPKDFPLPLALTLFDVCGVVPQVERLCAPGSLAVILGASGKAGVLATYAASRAVGAQGRVLGVVPSEDEAKALRELPANVRIVACDARNAQALEAAVLEASDGRHADSVIDCANVPGVEIGAAMCCRDGGTVYFFNMATRFQAAALGAELAGRDIQYVIGYGLLPDAAPKALRLVLDEPVLRKKLGGTAHGHAGR